MTKIKLNPLFAGMSGKMGNVIIKTSRNGQTYISRCPNKSKAEPSEAQLAQRQVFGKASNYAKAALADEAVKAFYEALAKASYTTARAVCMGDYMNAPTIEYLGFSRYQGQVGDRILITTHDDVGVVDVYVKLAGMDGAVVENGKAVELSDGSGYWEYAATMPVLPGTHIQISVEAFDRPGNHATARVSTVVEESH